MTDFRCLSQHQTVCILIKECAAHRFLGGPILTQLITGFTYQKRWLKIAPVSHRNLDHERQTTTQVLQRVRALSRLSVA
jgi:hypothetical protein